MTKSDFDKWKFAGSLPPILVLHQNWPPLYAGGASPGFDINTVDLTDRRIILKQVWYTTPKRIHGLLHYDGPTQLFFVGYECGQCGEVSLVPDSVNNETELCRALRHKCMRWTGSQFEEERFDLRTRVLHIVQDIGRSSDLGSVGCEQYADMLMELLEAPQ